MMKFPLVKVNLAMLIEEERARQDLKWGTVETRTEMTLYSWLVVLAEEFGEFAKALLEGSKEEIKTELVQTIAVGCAIYEWIEHNEDKVRN